MSAFILRHTHKSAIGAFMCMASTLFAGPQEDFLSAAKRNNLKLAQKAYANGGVEVNVADDKGKNAVVYTCENGSTAFLTWLGDVQADLSVVDAEGNNCYHLALKARNPKAVFNWLAERGIDKNARNQSGRTPLMLAVTQRKKTAFDALLNLQVDLDATDSEGYSALALAYEAGNLPFFQALLAAGAKSAVVRPKSGELLLLDAVKRERAIFAKALIEADADTKITDSNGDNLPVLCVKQALPEILSALLVKGYPVEAKDVAGKTLLQLAHESLLKRLTASREKVFSVLINAGANPNTLSLSGRSILMEQAENGRYNQVKLLLERGADIGFRDKTGNTVLHSTAQRNQLGTMRLLVEKFTDLNLAGDSGNTAAHFAARAGGSGILKLLKDKGANLELKNSAGDTPLSIAIGRQDVATTRALVSLGVSLSDEGRETPLMMEIAKSGAVNARTVELLTVLRKAGANINAVNRYGNNALSYALSRKNLRMAEALLKAGAQSEAGDAHGNTLLHKLALSAKFNRLKNQELTEWINLVLSYQHPDFQNSAGETALHLAATNDHNPDTEAARQFFETLVNYSASVQITDKRNRSVWERARKLDWERIAAANLPGPVAKEGIVQPAKTEENDRFLHLASSGQNFFVLYQQGSRIHLVAFDESLGLKAQREFTGVSTIAAAQSGGILVGGVRPGEIDGVADNKCRAGQNLVVFVQYLDSRLEPRWEHTWGKSGSCNRTAALAVAQGKDGNIFLYAEFSGKRMLRCLHSTGAHDGAEDFTRKERATEIIPLDDGTVALPSQNVMFNSSDGQTIGKITKSRGYRAFALHTSGIKFLLGDFNRLSQRKGVSLWSEDGEGKTIWTKNFAGESTMTIEQMAVNADRVCLAGKTDGALHGQAHSQPGKLSDYYVLCLSHDGIRIFTRILPAENLKLVAMRLNDRGDLVTVFVAGNNKNADVIMARIDREGRVFR